MERVYLDNAATSFPKAPGMAEVLSQFIEKECVNSNRTSSIYAEKNFDFIFNLRSNLCRLFNSENPECIGFTQNTTEALNWVIKGLVQPGNHVLVSGFEHNSVMRVLVQIKADFEVFSDIDDLKNKIKPDTKAIIVTAASNVSGEVFDLHPIAGLISGKGIHLIVDAAQAAPFYEVDMTELNASAICFAGHKSMLGPEGTGGFVLRKDIAKTINPLIVGGTGSQSDSIDLPTTLPDRLNSGTMNLLGLKGLDFSLSYVLKNKEKLKENAEKMMRRLYEGLMKFKQLEIVGPGLDKPRTEVISVKSDVVDVADLASYLAQNGIETRVGMHCSPMAHKSLGTFPNGTLRFSPGPFTTENEIDFTFEVLRGFFH